MTREDQFDLSDRELQDLVTQIPEREWLQWLSGRGPGAALRAMRLRRHMTQVEVAEFAEISPGYLSHLEHMREADTRAVSRDVLMAIATGLSATPTEFNIILEKFGYAGYAHTRRRRAHLDLTSTPGC